MKKLLIIDDVPLFMSGLANYLQQHLDFDIHKVDLSETGILQTVDQIKPDFVIVNIYFGDQVNLELLKSIHKLLPNVKLLAVAKDRVNHVVLSIFKSGCQGLLLKSASEKAFLKAVQTIQSGEDFYTQDSVRIILDHLSKGNPDIQPPPHPFSVRELEIIQLICKQLTAKEIAQELFISDKTVDFHRQKLMEKMGVRNMTGIVLFAIKNKIIDMEDLSLIPSTNEKDAAG